MKMVKIMIKTYNSTECSTNPRADNFTKNELFHKYFSKILTRNFRYMNKKKTICRISKHLHCRDFVIGKTQKLMESENLLNKYLRNDHY